MSPHRSYKSNLEQIRNAVLETVYIGVLEAFLRCKTVTQVWSAKYGAQASASRVRTAMAQEVEDWACVQVGSPPLVHNNCMTAPRLPPVSLHFGIFWKKHAPDSLHFGIGEKRIR